MKKHFPLLIGCILGILFRLLLIYLYPQPFQFDQQEYYNYALQILTHGIFAEVARLYGYPLILAIIFKFFTIYSLLPVFVFQAVLDTLTAILIYKWAKLLFIQKSIPWIAFILYLLNPYTSAYVGVALSEVTGIFFVTLMMYLFTLFLLKKNPAVWLLFCFIAGFSTQIRPVFLYAAVGLFVCSTCLYWAITKLIRVRLLMVTAGLFLFIIPFLYTLFGNVLYFKEWKLTNVDHILPRELFISIMVPDRAPYHIRSGFEVYPPEVMHLYYTYSIQPKNQKERAMMGNAYLSKSLMIIKENPWLFIRQRIGKMFFVWEKHYLLYFQQIQHEFEDKLIYWSNTILLVFGITGLIIWNKDKKKNNKNETLLARIYLIFLIYISLVHSVSLAEDRYSLPGYPLLFIFASFSIVLLWKKVKIVLKQ